jgi:hypothetical protein
LTILCWRVLVSIDDFHQFVSLLENQDVEVTNANFGGLSLLCDEFRFAALSERLSAFRQSADFKEMATMEDPEARLRLSGLEERLLQRDDDFAALRQTQESTAAALTAAVADRGAICTRTACECFLLKDNGNSPPGAKSRSGTRFNDHFGLSGCLCRVPRQTVLASVTGRPRPFRRARLSPPVRWPREHFDFH